MGINNPGGGGFTDILKWYDQTLAAPGRFDVTGISQGYTTATLLLSNLRSDAVTEADFIYLQHNGDAVNANYRYERLSADITTVSAAAGDLPIISIVPGASAAAGLVANCIIIIGNYTSTNQKVSRGQTVLRRDDVAGNQVALEQFGHAWESGVAIDRIQLGPDGGSDDFEAGARLQIWLYK